MHMKKFPCIGMGDCYWQYHSGFLYVHEIVNPKTKNFAANSASAPPMSPCLKIVNSRSVNLILSYLIYPLRCLAFELAVHLAKVRTPSQVGF